METIAILITGYSDSFASPGWLKSEFQKIIDHDPRFADFHLRVKMVEVTYINPEGGVDRAQTKAN